MAEIPSPILIFGDIYLSKNNIIATKKKYPNYVWVTKSASEDDLDSIRAEAGISSWDDNEKILLIKDLPNKKQVRDFLINLSSTCPIKTKIIIWDSEGKITIDPKEKTIDKTWSDFVNDFRNIKGSKIVNNGEDLTEKGLAGFEYVVKCFKKYNKSIGEKEAKLLLNIVGYDRGMIDSDIKKMSLTCSDNVTCEFILDNAFPTNKEAILYKIGNVLDGVSFENAINLIEKFLASGTNHNEIAAIIMKKARWQMAVAHLWSSGLEWDSIANRLMEMGKFPSSIWHNEQMDDSMKRREAEPLQSPENMVKYMSSKEGIPIKYFNVVEKSVKKTKATLSRKNAEIIPMYFMAEQTVSFVRDRIVRNSKFSIEETKNKILNRAIKTYLICHDKMVGIRCNDNPDQDLYEMIRCMMSFNLEKY
jgi:hypothetical protein